MQRHRGLIRKYLKGDKVHDQAITPEYKIEFTPERGLKISAYLFTSGDLQQEGSAFFSSWAYIPGKGFYLIDNLYFSSVDFIVPRAEIADFVDKHRFWLQRFDGFQIHLSSVETKLSYSISDRGLYFGTVLDVAEDTSDMIDLGRLVYLKGRGFYAKSSTRVDRIATGTFVLPEHISTFIRHHREELEAVPGFFTSICPIVQAGFSVFLNKQGRIVVKPQYTFLMEPVKIFGDYTYVEKQGFCEIPLMYRLPEQYRTETIITPDFEPYFLGYEIDMHQQFILSIDPRIKRPENLSLRVNAVKKEGKSSWLLDMDYESEEGLCSVFDVWRAFNDNERYLFSNCGLLSLKQSRFHWLKGIPKKRFVRKDREIRLSTLEWIRLSAFEPMTFAKHGKTTKEKIESFLSFETPELPQLEGLKSNLRPYQEKGLQWLWFLYCNGLSGMLCDEMGLGKTHQAMSLICAVRAEKREQKAPFKVLVVCPTSVMYHWQDLLKRFLPDVDFVLFHGAQRNLPEKYELLLTSYGILRSEQKFFAEQNFDLAVFDEVQIAKNAKSQTHKALRGVQAEMRLGLTGTPIENALIELKALFDVILPGYMPNEAIFKELFVNPVEKKQDEEKKDLLGKLIKPFILRRKKTEVLLELPEKIEQISYCYLSEEQRKMYEDLLNSSKDTLVRQLTDEKEPVPYIHIFALLTALKRICDHPCLLSKNGKDYKKYSSGKWDLFVELLKEARESGQKVVVFSQYLDMLDIIEQYLREEQVGFAGIRGSTRDRMEQLTRFREDPSCEVFVASLQAAGVGIDLVSASIVIHYDRWWNPARENQATDRVHRMGQNRGVQVFKMVVKDTIEEGIHQIIERKQGLLESVIGYDDQDQIKGLSRQELIEVLQMSMPLQ